MGKIFIREMPKTLEDVFDSGEHIWAMATPRRLSELLSVKTDEKTGRFLKNGQSRKKGLNRSISDASWSDLILKIEYLAVKQGKVVIKINPKYSSQECRNCGHTDESNRDGEKFICTECGYHEHADIGAAKTIRDRGLEIVRGDSAKLAV
ncbi:zinc ribbon domain-containing protein [Anabaena sphaerica]|uniref:zinc ribbon domain-containing protein n=1 Tax=Anabaena sphaerica TaxID=212446 RepID=UPI0018EF7497|nr:zinc ribbon domain-containing protein [Anabaena sphaerica]